MLVALAAGLLAAAFAAPPVMGQQCKLPDAVIRRVSFAGLKADCSEPLAPVIMRFEPHGFDS